MNGYDQSVEMKRLPQTLAEWLCVTVVFSIFAWLIYSDVQRALKAHQRHQAIKAIQEEMLDAAQLQPAVPQPPVANE